MISAQEVRVAMLAARERELSRRKRRAWLAAACIVVAFGIMLLEQYISR